MSTSAFVVCFRLPFKVKQFLFLPSVLLTLFVHGARAQSVDAVSPAVRLDQLAIGVRQPLSDMNHEFSEKAPKPFVPRPFPAERTNQDSTKLSQWGHIGRGAAIGAIVGSVAGLVASRREQSIEVDIGTTAYMALGTACGAILGALVGWWVYFQH